MPGQKRLAEWGAFFRAFELSCFRDPPGDFAFCELTMKTNHENMKVRKHEKEEGKLDRTRAKSGELARTRSNSLELARTRSNFVAMKR